MLMTTATVVQVVEEGPARCYCLNNKSAIIALYDKSAQYQAPTAMSAAIQMSIATAGGSRNNHVCLQHNETSTTQSCTNCTSNVVTCDTHQGNIGW